MSGEVWTDERVLILRRMWTAGDRVYKIVAELGGGVTHNAVIGKAHRLHLTRGKQLEVEAPPTVPQLPPPPLPKPQKTKRTPQALPAPSQEPSESAAPAQGEIIDLPTLPVSRRILIYDLKEPTDRDYGTCHWPIWGNQKPTPDTAFYCGIPTTMRDGVYCQFHNKIARDPYSVRRKGRPPKAVTGRELAP